MAARLPHRAAANRQGRQPGQQPQAAAPVAAQPGGKGFCRYFSALQCLPFVFYFRQHRTIPALRLKAPLRRISAPRAAASGGCAQAPRCGSVYGTASALPKCSIIHKVLSALLAFSSCRTLASPYRRQGVRYCLYYTTRTPRIAKEVLLDKARLSCILKARHKNRGRWGDPRLRPKSTAILETLP